MRQLARYRLGAIRQDVGDGLVVTALGGAAVQERHAVVVDADDVEVVPVHVLPDEGGIGEGLPSGQVSGAYLQLGGYRTLVLSRSSQCVTVRVVIGSPCDAVTAQVTVTQAPTHHLACSFTR
jgi:hypothetical protein